MTISPTSKDNTKNGIGYLLAFAIPGIIVASVVLGRRPGWADYMAFALIIIAFCVVPTVSVLKLVPDRPPCRRFKKHIAGRYVHLLPIIAFPIQILVLAIGVAHSINPGMGPLGTIGWLLSVGLFSALFGITASHELIHRRSKFARVLGGILLSTACFGCFKVVHIRLHHRYVGTDHDFASAQRGDSIYAFWLRALIGNPREAVRLERDRLQRLNRSLWRSELVTWYGLSTLWFTLSVSFLGWRSGVFFLLQGLVAILCLEWTNYIQHYGLTRRRETTGRYEPVRLQNAWTIDCRVSNFALFNLLRHSDHHVRPQEPYYNLQRTATPRYPYPFGFIMLLALVTPLFRYVVHPLLDEVAATQNEPA